MDVGLIQLLIENAPKVSVILIVGYFIGKAVLFTYQEYFKNKQEKLKKEREEEEALKNEGRALGVMEAEKNAFKANSHTLRDEYYRHTKKIDELDSQITTLSKGLKDVTEELVREDANRRKEREEDLCERKKSGERLDSILESNRRAIEDNRKLLKIHEDLSDNYKEMNSYLKQSVDSLKQSVENMNSSLLTFDKKVSSIESELSIVKQDVHELKKRGL
jgi:chromosome segregation ATPase